MKKGIVFVIGVLNRWEEIMFQCKHKHKSKVDIIITDFATVKNVTIEVGQYYVYRCLECKCLVWEEADNGRT